MSNAYLPIYFSNTNIHRHFTVYTEIFKSWNDISLGKNGLISHDMWQEPPRKYSETISLNCTFHPKAVNLFFIENRVSSNWQATIDPRLKIHLWLEKHQHPSFYERNRVQIRSDFLCSNHTIGLSSCPTQ